MIHFFGLINYVQTPVGIERFAFEDDDKQFRRDSLLHEKRHTVFGVVWVWLSSRYELQLAVN